MYCVVPSLRLFAAMRRNRVVSFSTESVITASIQKDWLRFGKFLSSKLPVFVQAMLCKKLAALLVD